jgi:tetratricopeptide (TPR) repeat protein
MKALFVLAGAAMLAGAAASGPALAIGGGGSQQQQSTCKEGYVYDSKKQMCVKAEAGIIEDKALSDYAYALAREGRYQEALDTLDLMRNPATAEALNYRGYATRKLGRVDEGIGYYQQAIALDPNYTLVREYLGEAYVSQGNFELAVQQLGEIEKRCGTTCEAYEDLAEAIAGADI